MIAIVFMLLTPSEVPHVVTLSAVLEENGAAVNRTVAASFILWDHEQGGTPVWSESATADVRDGSLVIDLGDSRPLPAEVFAHPLWLEIDVDGQRLEPRNRIASVPFAFAAEHADDASTLEGLSVEDIATRAALRAPGAAEVSYANLVDLPRETALYSLSLGCDPRRRMALSPTCESTRCAAGGFQRCDGTCDAPGAQLSDPQICPNDLIGYLRAP